MILDGAAAAAGFDPLTLPPDRFLNWVYQWAMSRLDARGARSFEMALSRPEPGEESPEWSDEALAAEWDSMIGAG